MSSSGLTQSQREAVEHVDGPLLVLAGPGSGKTRVVTRRIVHLLEQGISGRNILALTFTNKAADEMGSRVSQLAPGANVWMGTFHRFCARLLRQYASHVGLSENFTIYDGKDSHQAFVQVLDAADIELTQTSPDRIATAISQAKNSLIKAADFQPRLGNPVDRLVAELYPLYENKLLESNAVDFDDLLVHVAHMLRENETLRQQLDQRFAYVLVDEYQDTNFAQYAIVRAISNDFPNLAVTGDPDQAIYGWRGANLGNILDFERDYDSVKVVRLEQNYRSTKNILRVADSLIAQNVRRKQKALFTENPDGKPVRVVAYPSQNDEANEISFRIALAVNQGRRRPRDFAILYRVNALSRNCEHALTKQGIPYQIVHGVEFYQRKEIKDVLAYLQLMNNPRDSVALRRIINVPPRGIGKKTVAQLASHAEEESLTMLGAAREAGIIPSLSKRGAVAVVKFVAVVDHLGEIAMQSLEEIVGLVLNETGYLAWLGDSETEEDANRRANVEELLSAAREFDHQHPERGALEAFLEQASLVNDVDGWGENNDKVTLMTLHAAKGLEFPVVYITAVEHGFLPHDRNMDDPERVEEERRLLFVGMTRAQEELQLSRACYRFRRGTNAPTAPSQFLMEIDRQGVEVVEPKTTQMFYDDFAHEDSYSEPVYEPLENQDHTKLPATNAVITTASQLFGQTDAQPEADKARVNVESFVLGARIMHPEHGPGKIIALGGSRHRRTATINFAAGPQQVKFVLAKSNLRLLN